MVGATRDSIYFFSCLLLPLIYTRALQGERGQKIVEMGLE